MELDSYFDSIVAGFVISVGGLSEAVVKESAANLLKWCRAKKSSSNYIRLERLASCLVSLFEQHNHDDRVVVPLLKTMDMLLKNDILYFLAAGKHPFSSRLLSCVKREVSKSSDVGKLKLCVELLILLLGFDDPVRPTALRSLVMLLGHQYPKVRKHASELLYLQLLADSLPVGPTADEVAITTSSGDENEVITRSGLASTVEGLDRANELLVTTVWDGGDIASTRAVREEVATALGISLLLTAGSGGNGKKVEIVDELNSYSTLVRDAGY
jgi:Tubulin folding cofactor D C terminal